MFNAKELDETGLYYYGARYYNPRSGIWMSPDPAFDGSMRKPIGLALYTYAHNNPVRLGDPSGLSAKTGTWTADDRPQSGYAQLNDEPAALGLDLRGPGTANAHLSPSRFDELDSIQGHPQSEEGDGWRNAPRYQGLAQLTGDAPEVRGPQLRRQLYADVAKTGVRAGAELAMVVVPGALARRAVLAAEGLDAARAAAEVAPPIARIAPGSLPAVEEESLLQTLGHIDAGTTPTGRLATKWGTPFKNWAGDLPGGRGGASPYLEYRVLPPAGTNGAGPLRVVSNPDTGEMFYTWTHYGDSGAPAFVRIR